MELGGLQKEKGPTAQDRKRRAGRDDVVRSCLPSSLALYWKLAPKLVQKFKQQVCEVDQAAYPEVTIESFVGRSSMGLLCPPAHGKRKQFKRIIVTTRGAHTHTLTFTFTLTHSLTYSLTHSLTHSHSHSHSITLSLSHSITLSLSHSITLSLSHSLTLSL